MRLLLWSSGCFAGLALNNLLVLVDQQAQGVDLSVWRALPALLGVLLLVYGLVREG